MVSLQNFLTQVVKKYAGETNILTRLCHELTLLFDETQTTSCVLQEIQEEEAGGAGHRA